MKASGHSPTFHEADQLILENTTETGEAMDHVHYTNNIEVLLIQPAKRKDNFSRLRTTCYGSYMKGGSIATYGAVAAFVLSSKCLPKKLFGIPAQLLLPTNYAIATHRWRR